MLRLAVEVGDARVLMETGAAWVRIGDLLLERNDAESAKRNLLEGIEVLLEWRRLGAETIPGRCKRPNRTTGSGHQKTC